MTDTRAHIRSHCSDLIKIRWTIESGRLEETSAILEDISPRGACLQTERPVPEHTGLTIHLAPAVCLEAFTIYCRYRDTGYFVGVEFEPGVDWSKRAFLPQHLLDLEGWDSKPEIVH